MSDVTAVSKAPLSANASLTILMCAIAAVGIQALMLSPLLPDIAADSAGLAARDRLCHRRLWRRRGAGRFAGGTAPGAMAQGAGDPGRFCPDDGEPRPVRRCLGLAGAGRRAVHHRPRAPASSCRPPMAWLPRLSAPEMRSRAVGKVIFGWSVAMVGGIPLAAFLADLIDWRSTFALIAAITAAMVGARWPGAARQRHDRAGTRSLCAGFRGARHEALPGRDLRLYDRLLSDLYLHR